METTIEPSQPPDQDASCAILEGQISRESSLTLAKPRLAHAFTRETAAENARKAAAVRVERLKREADAKATRIAKPQAAALSREGEHAELVVEQIARTRKVLNSDDLQPRERAQLLVALDKLLDRERILAGRPLPGSHRPSRPRKTGDAAGAAIQPEE